MCFDQPSLGPVCKCYCCVLGVVPALTTNPTRSTSRDPARVTTRSTSLATHTPGRIPGLALDPTVLTAEDTGPTPAAPCHPAVDTMEIGYLNFIMYEGHSISAVKYRPVRRDRVRFCTFFAAL